jgi:hypothetical protein
MEPNIQGGIIWCPSREENIDKTTKKKIYKEMQDAAAPQQSAVHNKQFFLIAPKKKWH